MAENKMSVQEKFGYVISTSDWYVIREKIDKDGKLHVYIHQRQNGDELLPLGYLLGSNSLIYEKREGKK